MKEQMDIWELINFKYFCSSKDADKRIKTSRKVREHICKLYIFYEGIATRMNIKLLRLNFKKMNNPIENR